MRLVVILSKNQQYKKFHLLLKVSPALAKLLDHVGPEAGHAFTKELNEVVRLGIYIIVFVHTPS